MRKTLFLLAACVLLAAVPTYADSPDPLHLYTRTLANGLLVAVVENSAVPLVTIEVGVHNGSMNEPLPLNGLSHLYEHMFFKGNAVIPTQEAYMKRLRQLGAVWNGTTGTERVNYFYTMGSQYLEPGLEFMSHAIKTPRFDSDELVRERQVVLGEFDRNEANPEYHLEHAMDQALWYQYPTYKDPLGTRSSIVKATVEQMRWMQKVYYIPNNSLLVVAGDVKAPAVFTLAEKYFGDWQKGPNPFIQYPLVHHPPLPAPKVVLVEQPVSTATISLNWQGPDTEHDLKGAIVADVFSFAVDQVGSRLQQALVDSGLAVSARVDYNTLRNGGEIGLSVQTTPDKVLDAVRAALNEAKHFGDSDYLTPEQWKSSQTLLAVNDLYVRERVSELPHELTFWWSVAGLDGYLNYIPRVQAATQADAAAYAQRYVVGQPMVLGAMTNPQEAAKNGITREAVDKILATVWNQKAGFRAALVPLAQKQSDTNELPEVQHFQVDGIDVLLRTNPATTVVAASAYVKGGSANLTPQNQGIENLSLHVAARGGTRTASRIDRARRLNSMGTSLGAAALADYSRLDLKCTRDFFDASWDIYASSFTEPAFAPADVELLRRRVINQIHGEKEDPDNELRKNAEEFLFRQHPYALRPLGTEAVVSRLGPTELADYYRALMVKSRMLLVVVGDIDRAHLERAIHGTLGKLPQGNWTPPSVPQVPQRAPAITIEERRLPTTYVRGMFPAPTPSQPDYAATRLMTSILSDRLFEEVRTKRNLSYAVFCGLSQRQANYGLLYVTSTDPSAAVAVMRDEIHKLASTPLSPPELEEAAAGFITHYFLAMETSDAQAQQWGEAQVVAGDWRVAFRLVEEVRHVTPQQVQAAAEKWIKGVQWSVLGEPSKVDRKLFEAL